MVLAVSDILSQQAVIKGYDNTELAFPWVGGMDACQFGAIDLNQDDIKDLMVFDRRGNRVLCFVNKGITNVIDYSYEPQYEKFFPDMEEWVILADYDADGKEDIFTYSPMWAGMKVFKNVSVNHLAFESVVYPYLTYLQGEIPVNIYATNADYPGITDVDQDGDLDIVTFWSLGGFIELYKNLSIEKYGNADSLNFTKADYCWGKVAENEESNVLFLDSCLFDKSLLTGKTRHRGATFQVDDFTGDGLIDCVLADVDYSNLVLLKNGGTLEETFFISQDTAFPSDGVPVKLFSMPVTALIDVNNDGVDDMLVSPFDPNPMVTENKTSIWLYLNIGTNELPVYQMVSKNFLQNNMIDNGSVSIPLLADINGDNLLDMLVGNFGKYDSSYYESGRLFAHFISQLTYYQNIGSANNPVFKMFSEDFGGLSALNLRGLSPAVGDLNLDGKTDLIVGSEEGKLIYVEQNESENWVIKDTNFGLIYAGAWCTPQLYDIDMDGTMDLIIGSENGKLAYYKGSSFSDAIHFQFVTDHLGNVDVTDYNLSNTGYSVPWFFKTPDNTLNLVVGSEKGKVFHFDQITGNLDGSFREIDALEVLLDTVIHDFDMGARSAACLADIDNDGSLEMIAGNYSGGLQLFNSSISVVPFVDHSPANQVFSVFPNPTSGAFHIRFQNIPQQKIEISIFTVGGQKLIEESYPLGLMQLDIQHDRLKTGMYWMNVIVGDFNERIKIVIL
jgi:hypothetical protein